MKPSGFPDMVSGRARYGIVFPAPTDIWHKFGDCPPVVFGMPQMLAESPPPKIIHLLKHIVGAIKAGDIIEHKFLGGGIGNFIFVQLVVVQIKLLNAFRYGSVPQFFRHHGSRQSRSGNQQSIKSMKNSIHNDFFTILRIFVNSKLKTFPYKIEFLS